MKKFVFFICLCSWLASPLLATADSERDHCPHPLVATTRPSPVKTSRLTEILAQIRTEQGALAYEIGPELKQDLEQIFVSGQVHTKMEQFYAMLFAIQNSSPLAKGKSHVVSGDPVRNLLIESGVFPDGQFPKSIDKVRFRRSSLTPFYEVHFRQNTLELPINQGEGFRAWDHGMCQHLKALVFRNPFSFYLKRLPKGNLQVYKFNNVDLKGVLGTRGIIDIDLEYVSLVSVTFIQNTPLGYVKARVAEKEFEVNEHSWILKVLTRFFADTAKQAIDW